MISIFITYTHRREYYAVIVLTGSKILVLISLSFRFYITNSEHCCWTHSDLATILATTGEAHLETVGSCCLMSLPSRWYQYLKVLMPLSFLMSDHRISPARIIAITQLAGNYLSFTIQQIPHIIVSFHNPLAFEKESENLSYHIMSLINEKKERSR